MRHLKSASLPAPATDVRYRHDDKNRPNAIGSVSDRERDLIMTVVTDVTMAARLKQPTTEEAPVSLHLHRLARLSILLNPKSTRTCRTACAIFRSCVASVDAQG
jgi:hypothetical protein